MVTACMGRARMGAGGEVTEIDYTGADADVGERGAEREVMALIREPVLDGRFGVD